MSEQVHPSTPPAEDRGTRPTYATIPSHGPSGWVAFASIILVMVGLFNVVFGLVALFQDGYYVVGPDGLLLFDLTGWGWVHLIVGVLAVAAGIALLTGAMWARSVAVILAGLNALAQLAFLPAYPAWSLIAITLDVLVIWAVVVHGKEAAGTA